MSLLNRATDRVIVFAENSQPCLDADGNKVAHLGVGQVCKAVIQPISTSESQGMGFETEEKLRMRLIDFPERLGARSVVEYQGKRYSVEGDGRHYHSSPRTCHVVYTLVRA